MDSRKGVPNLNRDALFGLVVNPHTKDFGVGVNLNFMKGFTLIELMIVIAIIAIVAAIAVPNLLVGRISANESSATSAMKLIAGQEATWLQQDPDGNGKKDYWTYDVSCLHRMYRADNTTKVVFISVDLARADAAPANMTGGNLPFGTPQIENWSSVSTGTKASYWFRVLSLDAPAGSTYQANNVGTNNIAAAHSSKFGFMAAPDVYGMSGVNSFIVNQEGTVYGTDTGLETDKWKTTAGGGANWPGANPPGTDGPGGRKWRVAE